MIGGLTLLVPGLVSDVIGFVIVAGLTLLLYLNRKKGQAIAG